MPGTVHVAGIRLRDPNALAARSARERQRRYHTFERYIQSNNTMSGQGQDIGTFSILAEDSRQQFRLLELPPDLLAILTSSKPQQ